MIYVALLAISDELHSIHAPHSSRCDLCLVSFCGIGIPRRCITLPLMSQIPEGLSELVQLLSCEEVVDVFNGNLIERDFFIDHVQANDISPVAIYRDVCVCSLSCHGLIKGTPIGCRNHTCSSGRI